MNQWRAEIKERREPEEAEKSELRGQEDGKWQEAGRQEWQEARGKKVKGRNGERTPKGTNYGNLS